MNLAANDDAQEQTQAQSAAEQSKEPVGNSQSKPLHEEPAANSDQSKTETNNESSKQETQSEPKNVVPQKYDLKVPDGSLLGEEAYESVSSFAKELGLSNEQAQKLLERESSAVASFVERGNKHIREVESQKWYDELQNDKDFGGEHFAENAEHAKNAFQKFATPGLIKFAKESGYGNHPDLFKTFAKIGRAMAPDKLVRAHDHSATAKKSAAEILYGGSTKKE